MGRWRATIAIAIAAALVAPRPALGAGESGPRVVVCVARESPAARVVAEDIARALAPVAPVRVGAAGASCDLDAPAERVLLVVDADGERVVLSARARAGRAYSPRTVERGDGGPILFREHVAVAARSLASAALDAESTPPASVANPASPPSSSAVSPPPSPSAVPPPPSSAAAVPPLAPASPPSVPPAPNPSTAPPASAPSAPAASSSEDRGGPRSPQLAPATPLLRLEAGYAAVTIGSALPVESGASIAAFWLAPRLRLGAAYAFFPGTGVASSDTSLVVTRHAVSAYAGAAYRTGAFELGGAAGPLLDVWLRSTTSTSGKATAPASYAGAGFSLRADAGYALTAALGIHAAFSAEIAPGSPEFRGPSGVILDPAVVRARVDTGFTLAVP